jgi:hypothetical protein
VKCWSEVMCTCTLKIYVHGKPRTIQHICHGTSFLHRGVETNHNWKCSAYWEKFADINAKIQLALMSRLTALCIWQYNYWYKKLNMDGHKYVKILIITKCSIIHVTYSISHITYIERPQQMIESVNWPTLIPVTALDNTAAFTPLSNLQQWCKNECTIGGYGGEYERK